MLSIPQSFFRNVTCMYVCTSLVPERLASFYSCSVFIGQCSVTGYIAPEIGAKHKIVFFSKMGVIILIKLREFAEPVFLDKPAQVV